jgi:hypothetical protein
MPEGAMAAAAAPGRPAVVEIALRMRYLVPSGDRKEATMSNFNVRDLRPFLPAKDFEVSKAFYVALGCTLKWDSPNLLLFELGEHRFYVSRTYNKDYAERTRLHITVEDTQSWFDHVSALVKNDPRFATVRVQTPRQESYGALVTFVHDPCGILLDFAQRTG